LDQVQVVRDPAVQSHAVEEIYQCDAAGVVEVAITDLTTGLARTFRVRETPAAERDRSVDRRGKGKRA
jgi:hypothetical protein